MQQKITTYSLIMTPTPRLAGCIISSLDSWPNRPTYSCARALTYLHSWLGPYKTGNICETVEDRAKVTIVGLYKVVHCLSIAAKMYDLEWHLSEIQGHWFLTCRKMTKYSLVLTPTPCIYVQWLKALSLLGLRIHAPVHLLTYLLTYTE